MVRGLAVQLDALADPRAHTACRAVLRECATTALCHKTAVTVTLTRNFESQPSLEKQTMLQLVRRWQCHRMTVAVEERSHNDATAGH